MGCLSQDAAQHVTRHWWLRRLATKLLGLKREKAETITRRNHPTVPNARTKTVRET